MIMAQATRVSGEGSQGVVLVLHDITGLRRADRIRRDFVANVSHELRTPLTAIRGYVEALLDLVPPDAEPRRFLDIIARHSSRMEGLVKDLLRLTRLEAGQEPLDRVACAPAHLFDGVVHDLEPLLARRHQQVTIGGRAGRRRRSSAIPPSCTTCCATWSRTPPTTRPKRTTITLSAQRDGDHVALIVEDEGPGIPEADRQRVFERFYRVDKARSRETGGTGLGLSIVKHLVGLHGGDVRVENRPSRRRALHREDSGMTWLLVGVGGALGSMARYGVDAGGGPVAAGRLPVRHVPRQRRRLRDLRRARRHRRAQRRDDAGAARVLPRPASSAG